MTQDERERGSYRGVIARQRNAAARKLRFEQIYRLADDLEREKAGPAMLAASLQVAGLIMEGELEPPSTPKEAKELAETAQILHKIARLELGESTANTIQFGGQLPDGQALAALRARLAELEKTQEISVESTVVDAPSAPVPSADASAYGPEIAP